MPWWCLGSRSHRHISAALLLLATLLTGCESHDETENTPPGPETGNRAPRPLAPAVSTLTNARGVTQVTPGDPDAEQAHTFAITVPPLHGKSTVNATGLMTYAPAPGFFGIDSLAVTVTDNGQPPLSGTVSIPIVVQAHPVLSPVVTITFPGTSALLTYSPVTVRGTAQGPHPITRVAVNGVPATTTDGFATWAAAIPLVLGKNDVTVSLEDERGQTNTAAATATITRVGPFFAAPFGIAVEASGHWVVVDAQLSAILRVDPATGTRTIVSDLSTGGGPALRFPRSIAVEASGHWVVVDAQLSAILRVDPATGIRTIVSDLSTGGGPIWSDPRGITVEASGHLAVVDAQAQQGAIIRVDPVTGTRTILSNQTIGSGPLLGNSYGVAVEADGHLVVAAANQVVRIDPATGDRAIVADSRDPSPLLFAESIVVAPNGQLFVAGPGGAKDPLFPFDTSALEEFTGIVRVDPTTGVFTSISDATTGSGPPLRHPRGLAVTADSQLVVTTDEGILRVDPATGDRTSVSREAVGTGPSLLDSRSLAVMIDGQLVVTTTQKVIQVDPATSRHTVLANTTTGAGPTLGLAASVAVEATGQLLIADSSLGAIIRVDPGTGDRTLVSDANTGGGPTLSRPQSIAVAPDGQLFVLDYEVIGLPSGVALEENRVLRVDPITGNRTLVSDGCGSGQLLTSIAIETAGTLVLVDPEGTAVWRVDPSTGNCTIVSSKLGDSDIFSEVGTGPGFRAPRGIAVEATGHLVVLDPQRTAVLRIETSTGDRTLVSDVGTGRGPLFSSLGPVVLLGVGIRPAPVLFALNDGIAVEASGHLVVMDPVLNAVIRVDTSSGDRAIIAK